MRDTNTIECIRQKYLALSPVMDERMRRQWAAAEASALGWGGVTTVSLATGLARDTIAAGCRELEHRRAHPANAVAVRIRSPGGGRKPLTETDPGLRQALDALVDPPTRGHPESPLRWTCKSTSKLAEELQHQGHAVSDRTVAHLLKQAGYSLQANRKTREGASHPDRNAQFEYINRCVMGRQKRGQPVVSVDTKKKELVGEFKNVGEEWQPKGEPVEVNVHDFPDKGLGKAIPYGVYDLASNEGWVSVGIDHDTAQFAVTSIGRWWQQMGSRRFPRASELMITADGGGSNGSRNRLWKWALQGLANDLGLALRVCHFPPGTSKWNKIEHRLFCLITQNWRGRPLTSYEVIVNLIASTTTKTGLTVRAALDTNEYETGIKISDEQLAEVNLTPAKFHRDWNYTIRPKK
ncbi:MAG: ISAzo13 family transposase [Planctomycetaceae bacterium]|nr:ISAzo13 family transposase [Planctomycetaceae bacterium]